MKRVLCIFLAILILVISVVIPYQRANAFVVTAGVISSLAISGIVSVLIAAGLQFANSEQMQLAAYDFIIRTPERVINNLSFIRQGVQGIATDLWDAAVGYVNDRFNVGQNSVQGQTFTHNTFQGTDVTATTRLTIPLVSDLPHIITWTINPATNSSITGQRLGVTAGIEQWVFRQDGGSGRFVGLPAGEMPQLTMINNPQAGGLTYRILTSVGNIDFIQFRGVAIPTITNTGTAIIDNPVLQTKPTLVNVSTLPQKVNLTRDNIIITPYMNTWTGLFSDVITPGITWEKVGFDENTVGTWSGTWDTTLTGQKTFTGTVTVAGVTTNVSARTISIPITQIGDIGRWRTISDLFTTRFPFSLPWDLVRAFSTMQVARQAPRWTITFPSNIFIGGGNVIIDFIQFDTWAVIIRWGVLILFNIGLILVTRKIIGAGG